MDIPPATVLPFKVTSHLQAAVIPLSGDNRIFNSFMGPNMRPELAVYQHYRSQSSRWVAMMSEKV